MNAANHNIRKVSGALIVAKKEPPAFFPGRTPRDTREHYAQHAHLLASMDLTTMGADALKWDQAAPITQAQYLAIYYTCAQPMQRVHAMFSHVSIV
jgi:hypothetical protein